MVHALKHSAIPKWFVRILLAVILASVITNISAIMQAQVSHAWAPFGLDKICDAQYSMSPPGYSDSPENHGHKVNGTDVSPSNTSYKEIQDPWGAYGTSGYDWVVYETFPCDPGDTAQRTAGNIIANWLFGWLAAMLSLIRAYITVPFSSDLITPFISSDIVKNIFRTFDEKIIQAGVLSLIMSLGMAWILFTIHRNGFKITVSRIIGSIAASSVAAALVSTQITSNLYTNGNKIASDISLIPAAAVAGNCSSGGGEDANTTVKCISGVFSSRVITPVYMYGAIGENKGDEKAKFISGPGKTPEELGPGSEVIYNKKSNSYISDDKFLVFDTGGQGDAVTIKLPDAGVVPTVNSDNPTWSEYMRWTSSYTTAEKQAIDAGEIQACSLTTMPSLEKLHEQAEKTPDLCTKKWQVRAALLYSMAAGGGGYQTAAGKTPFADRLPAVATNFIPTYLMGTAVAFLGMHRMLINLDLIFLALMVWFRFALMSVTGNWGNFKYIVGDHGIVALKIIGLGLVLSGVVLAQGIVYNVFEESPILGGMSLYARGGLTAAVTLLAFITCYILYFRGMRRIIKNNEVLARAQAKTIGGHVKTATVKTLNTGAAAAGAAMTGGMTAGLTAIAMQVLQKSKQKENEELDLEKNFAKGHTRGSEQQRSRDAKQRKASLQNIAKSQIRDTQPQYHNALDDAFNTADEYESLNEQIGDVQKQHNIKSATLANTAEQQELEQKTANTKKENYATQKAEHDAKLRERVNMLLGSQQQYADSAGNPVMGPNGVPLTYSDKLSEASHALAQARSAQAQAEAKLKQYLSDTDRNVMHQLNYDKNGQAVDVTVTDLATGSTRTAPVSEYDHDFSQANLFSTAEEYSAYQQLKTALDTATGSVREATEGYEALANKLSGVNGFKADMYTPSIDAATIAQKYNLSTDAVANLRVSFDESKRLNDLRAEAQSQENIARRAAMTARDDLKKEAAAHAKHMTDLTAALSQKDKEYQLSADRAKNLASRIDQAYTNGGMKNIMQEVSSKNPYTITTENRSVTLTGENLRAATEKALNEARKQANLNTPPNTPRIEP